jgi:drug/metabolite transporter (DMT)-like permease
MQRQTADLMLLVTMVLWALNFIASKYILSHGFAPLAYAMPRYAAAATIFALGTLTVERSLRVARRDLPLIGGAILILFCNQVAFTYAIHFSSASTVALVFGTVPIFTGLIAAVTGVQRLSRRFAAGAAVSFAGVALIAAGSGKGLSGSLKGDAIALGGAATWAAYSVAAAPLMTRYSPLRISAWVIGGTTLLLAPVAASQLAHQGAPDTWQVWPLMAFSILGPLVLTNVLWFTAIDRVGISRASLFYNLQFFLAAAFGVLLLSETFSAVQVAGGALIAAAILLSRLRRPPTPQPVE